MEHEFSSVGCHGRRTTTLTDMTSPLTPDRIVPVAATCELSLFENSGIGLQPSVTFGAGIDCEPLTWVGEDGEEFESELSVQVDCVPFHGRT